MAPSAKILEGDLQKATRHLYETDEDNLTVNAVRKRAEEMRDLDEGFFAAPEWKAKSKTIITEFLEQLHNDEKVADESDDQTASSTKPRAKPKATNGAKRSSPSGDKPAPKRQRKAPAVRPTRKKKPTKKAASDSELSEEEEESELSDLSEDEEESAPESDLSEDEEPPPKKRAKKAAPKKVAKKVADSNSESELSDPDASTEEEKPKSKPKSQAAKAKIPARPKSKSKVAESDSEAEKMIVDNDKEEGAKTSADPKASAPDTTVKTGDIINSDSELSSVIDEPPPKKRGKGAAAKGKPKTATPKAPKELSADDEEIKKLQGHLVKCGIRKIWGIELKKYGDDTKAKIRHLRGMLADAGMSGRFSEARAKEIKEQRELMADLEAVQDMNALWGESGKGGRASRSRANRKSLKEDSGDDDENDENDEGNDEDEGGGETKANPRVSKRMTDLAFLGDESESD